MELADVLAARGAEQEHLDSAEGLELAQAPVQQRFDDGSQHGPGIPGAPMDPESAQGGIIKGGGQKAAEGLENTDRVDAVHRMTPMAATSARAPRKAGVRCLCASGRLRNCSRSSKPATSWPAPEDMRGHAERAACASNCTRCPAWVPCVILHACCRCRPSGEHAAPL